MLPCILQQNLKQAHIPCMEIPIRVAVIGSSNDVDILQGIVYQDEILYIRVGNLPVFTIGQVDITLSACHRAIVSVLPLSVQHYILVRVASAEYYPLWQLFQTSFGKGSGYEHQVCLAIDLSASICQQFLRSLGAVFPTYILSGF